MSMAQIQSINVMHQCSITKLTRVAQFRDSDIYAENATLIILNIKVGPKEYPFVFCLGMAKQINIFCLTFSEYTINSSKAK